MSEQPDISQDLSQSNAENLANSDNPDSGGAVDSRSALSARLKASKNVELYVFEDEAAADVDALVDVSSLNVDIDQQERQNKYADTIDAKRNNTIHNNLA